jgi:hypothetical protein
MKTVVMALTALVVASSPALADKICIDTRDIKSSKSTDGRTIVFKMEDGTTLVNHLQGYCPDLKFFGYTWILRSGDMYVCENSQPLRVNQSMQICTLGKFDPPKTEKHASN